MEPVICENCGQVGNERPGFSVLPLTTIFLGEDAVLVTAIKCNNCDHVLVVPAGDIEVRMW